MAGKIAKLELGIRIGIENGDVLLQVRRADVEMGQIIGSCRGEDVHVAVSSTRLRHTLQHPCNDEEQRWVAWWAGKGKLAQLRKLA